MQTWLSNPQAGLSPKSPDLWRPSRALIDWLYAKALLGEIDTPLFRERMFMAQPDLSDGVEGQLSDVMQRVIEHYDPAPEPDRLMVSRATSVLQRILDRHPEASADFVERTQHGIDLGTGILAR